MTKAAQHYGKDLSNFMRSPDTRDYIDALEHSVEITACIAKRGGAPGQAGTWAHPKLAVFFARWLDVRFAVWCDITLDEILRGRAVVQVVAPEEAPLSLATVRQMMEEVARRALAGALRCGDKPPPQQEDHPRPSTRYPDFTR